MLSHTLDNDCGACKLPEVSHTHPTVFCRIDIYALPGMILIHRRERPGLYGDVLHTTIVYESRPRISQSVCPTPLFVKADRERSVDDNISGRRCGRSDRRYGTLPSDIHLPSFPSPIRQIPTEHLTANALYPLLGGRAHNNETATLSQTDTA